MKTLVGVDRTQFPKTRAQSSCVDRSQRIVSTACGNNKNCVRSSPEALGIPNSIATRATRKSGQPKGPQEKPHSLRPCRLVGLAMTSLTEQRSDLDMRIARSGRWPECRSKMQLAHGTSFIGDRSAAAVAAVYACRLIFTRGVGANVRASYNAIGIETNEEFLWGGPLL
jgi:hypothetical protein